MASQSEERGGVVATLGGESWQVRRRTVSLLRYQDDKRDWRQLATADVRRHFEQLRARAQAPAAGGRLYGDEHRQGPEGPRHAE
ncbi:unnamed protein product, partial [Prorocentrum cordatum]